LSIAFIFLVTRNEKYFSIIQLGKAITRKQKKTPKDQKSRVIINNNTNITASNFFNNRDHSIFIFFNPKFKCPSNFFNLFVMFKTKKKIIIHIYFRQNIRLDKKKQFTFKFTIHSEFVIKKIFQKIFSFLYDTKVYQKYHQRLKIEPAAIYQRAMPP